MHALVMPFGFWNDVQAEITSTVPKKTYAAMEFKRDCVSVLFLLFSKRRVLATSTLILIQVTNCKRPFLNIHFHTSVNVNILIVGKFT